MLLDRKFSIAVANHSSSEHEKLNLPYVEVCNADGNIKPVGFNFYDSDFLDNISNKNKTYCELSVLYSFWKQGIITDTFGLAHYRRLFCLDNSHEPFDVVLKPFEQRYDFAAKQLDYIDNYKDSVVVGYTGLVGGSIWNQFKVTHPDLFDFFSYTCEVFGQLYSDLKNPINFFHNNSHLNHCNMFIAPKDIVVEWCEIIFPLLSKVESEAPFNLDNYSLRWAGFFSERFFTYYISSLNNKINTIIKPIIMFG